MGETSPFSPRSPQAQAITDLFVWNLAIAGVIFVLVTGLVIYIAIRYRARPGAVAARPVDLVGGCDVRVDEHVRRADGAREGREQGGVGGHP